jgi:hypothetical protein
VYTKHPTNYPVLSQTDPVYVFTAHFYLVLFNIILPSRARYPTHSLRFGFYDKRFVFIVSNEKTYMASELQTNEHLNYNEHFKTPLPTNALFIKI